MAASNMSPATLVALNPAAPSSQPDVPSAQPIDIIVIPGLGHQIHTPARGQSPWTWLLALGPEIRLWAFDYAVQEDKPIWNELIQRGDELIDAVMSTLIVSGTGNRTLVIVCHGLGGIIAKRAIAAMSDRSFDPVRQRILRIISGIVFLGTPHLSYRKQNLWKRLGSILQLNPKFTKKLIAQAEVEAAILANVCQKFVETGVDIPILSVFETQKTKIKSSWYSRGKKILVDADLAETQMGEVLTPSIYNHKDIWNVSNDNSVVQEIKKILAHAESHAVSLEESHRNVSPKIANHDVWNSTIAASETEPAAEFQPNDSSGLGATAGSSEGQFEIIPAIRDFTKPKKLPQLPIYWLQQQSRNPDFIGRETVLTGLDRALLPTKSDWRHAQEDQSQGIKSYALCGLGGLGKTQIAAEYAYTRKTKFDAVFWLPADSTAKLDEAYEQIAIKMGLMEQEEARDLVISRSIFLEWLSSPHGRSSETKPDTDPAADPSSSMHDPNPPRWLMIFDNADNLDDLHDFWPSGHSGSILITSRDPLAKTFMHPELELGLDLQPFAFDEGKQLLQKVSGNRTTTQSETENMKNLLELLGGLPLVIVPVATMIRRQNLTFQQLMDMAAVDKAVINWQKLKVDQADKTFNENLAMTWAISKITALATSLLELLSILDPDAIFEGILTLTDSDEICELAPPGYPCTEADYYLARSELWKSSLVSHNKELQQLKLHRVTQDVVRASIPSDRFQQTFQFAVKLLWKAWPQGPHAFSHVTWTWKPAERIYSHITQLYFLFNSQASDLSGLGSETEILLGGLMQKAGWYQYERGNFELAADNYSIALGLLEKYPDDALPQLADTLVSLSALTTELNDPEKHLEYAERHYKARMRLKSTTTVPHIQLGMAYTQRASAYGQVGRYDEAIAQARLGREVLETFPGYINNEYWPFYATVYEALPLMALGRNAEAAKLLMDCISWRESKYGVDDTQSFQLGFALHLLANIREHQGGLVESFQLYQRALANYRATMGKNYHRVGTVCTKLARHQMREKEYRTAGQLLDQAEKIFKLRPYYKPELTRTIFIRSELLQATGDHSGAREMLRQATTSYKELLQQNMAPGMIAINNTSGNSSWDVGEDVGGSSSAINKKTPVNNRPESVPNARDFDQIVLLWSR